MKVILPAFIVVFLNFFFLTTVYAVDIEITDFPEKVENEFEVKFNLSGAKSGTNYFRLLLKKDDKDTKLIETWNGDSWYSGTSGKSYFPYSVTPKIEGLIVKGRLKSGSNFEGGEYNLSIKRYTQSGSAASSDNVNEVKVNLIKASTPEPTPEIEVTPEVIPSTDPVVVAKTQIVETEAPVVLSAESENLTESAIPSPSSIPEDKIQLKDNIEPPTNLLGVVLLTTGIAFMTVGTYLFWKEGGLVDIIKR